jgi:Fe(3+) dicitrate transport protein
MNTRIIAINLIFFLVGVNGLYAQIKKEKQDTIAILELDNVTIEHNKKTLERKQEVEGYSIFSAKKNDIVKVSNLDANLVNNNPRQLFSRVAGVSIWENDGSGTQVSVGVRGLNPNRSWEFNTRQNGYDISSDVFGYPEAYYNPPMEAVDRIEIIRGGASLQFGSQFGGLLNYVLKKEKNNKPLSFESQNTVGSYGMFSSYNALSGNTKKWNYSFYNHYRKGDGWRQNGQYEVRNTYGFLQYKFNERTTISAEYTNMDYKIQQSGGLTDAQYNESSRQSFRQRNWFSTPWQVANLEFNTLVSKDLSFNVKVFGLLGERNSIGFLATPNVMDTINRAINSYNHRQVDRDFYKNIGSEFRGMYSYRLFKQKSNLAFGARVYRANTTRKQRGKGDTGFEYNTNILTNKYQTELDFTTNNFALFAENLFKLSKKLSITPGLRYESISSSISGLLNTVSGVEVMANPNVNKRTYILAGIGLEYQLKQTNIYANISQAYRPILFSDITPPATTDVIDENLKDANGITSDIGYRGTVKDFLSFDVSAFYIQYNNRIGTIRQFVDNDPTKATYQFRTNLGESVNQGFEAFVDLNIFKALKMNKKYGNFSVFGSLAFINAEYKEFRTTSVSGSAPNVIISESNLKNKKVEYAPNQIHNFGITFSVKELSVTMQTRISGAVYTDATNTVEPNSTGTIGKLDGYQIYDLSMTYGFLKNYNVRFSINNLLDTKFATRRAGGYPGPGILPGEGRIVNLGFGLKL